jgi:hypothetical protein
MQRGRPPKAVVEEYFEVEQILCRRIVRGCIEYLVKWKGFEEKEATWESAANLTSVLDMVLEFEQQQGHEQPPKDVKGHGSKRRSAWI